MSNQADPGWVFYHALYHLVTHWAATVAITALLLTLGAMIATTTGPIKSRGFVSVAVVAVAAMALYFLFGMYRFGQIVNSLLPPDYVQQTMLLPHPWNLAGGAIVIVVVGVADLCLAWRR